MMFHYFVAIVLPPDLNEKVLEYKKYMFDRYGCKTGLKSPAHITLVPPFWMNQEKEEELIEDLIRLAHYSPFPISTEGFSAFPPRTIFINPTPSEELHQLKRKADEIFCKPGGISKREERPFHPHITIATRDLSKKAFHEAWEYFEKKIFHEEWLVQDVSLLRHNQERWEVIRTILFQK
jgi:2'-5' RNA ligase